MANAFLCSDDPLLCLYAWLGCLCIGLSKSGLSGTATLGVVFMAKAFGGKASVGLVLPLLIFADFIGFWINRKGGSWSAALKLAPPALLGIGLGWILLDQLENQSTSIAIGIIILALLILKAILDHYPRVLRFLSEHPVFSNGMGLLAGITTMLANAAGPIMTTYLLTQRLEKAHHIGIFTRFFLFINLSKLPFSTHLGLIHSDTLRINLQLLPAVIIGLGLGWWILRRIHQTTFERLITALTLFSALWLIASNL